MILTTMASDTVSLGLFSIDKNTLFGSIVAIALAAWHRFDLGRIRKHIVVLRKETLSALGLHEVIVADEDLERGVREVGTQFARVREEQDPLLLQLARRDIYKAGHFMNMAAEAHITWGSDAFSHAERLASSLLDTAQRGDELWASSLVDAEFWSRATAYLRHQEEKAKEGVTIHRVFAFEQGSEDIDSDRTKQQIELQRNAGIHVTQVEYERLPPPDLVVVLKPEKRHSAESSTATMLMPAYAMECRIGSDKRIDHVDLWAARGLQSEMVLKSWWTLHGIFLEAPDVEPPVAPSETTRSGGMLDFRRLARLRPRPMSAQH